MGKKMDTDKIVRVHLDKNAKGTRKIEKGGSILTTSKEKIKMLQDVYIRQNIEKNDPARVNWATSKDLEEHLGKFPNTEVYMKELANRQMSNSVHDIVLNEDQKCLKLVNYCSLNLFDMSNPQAGRIDGSWKDKLKNMLAANSTNKVVLALAGDLVGTEWEWKYLVNADYNKQYKLYNYFGLMYRKRELIKIVDFALRNGADEVLLLNGAQEHIVMKKSPTKRDILQEVSDHFKNSDNADKIHYLNQGVSVSVNLVKKNEKTSTYYSTIGFQTNMTNKAQTAQADYVAALRNNGRLEADAVFVSNGNTAGKYGENLFFVSSQAIKQKTAKGKIPGVAPEDYNVFYIYPEASHDLVVVTGNGDIETRDTVLSNKISTEMERKEILAKIAKEKIEAKLNAKLDQIEDSAKKFL